jgi:hypothetical protein
MTLRDFIAERLEAVYGEDLDRFDFWDLIEKVEDGLLFDALNDQIDAAAQAVMREQHEAAQHERDLVRFH